VITGRGKGMAKRHLSRTTFHVKHPLPTATIGTAGPRMFHVKHRPLNAERRPEGRRGRGARWQRMTGKEIRRAVR